MKRPKRPRMPSLRAVAWHLMGAMLVGFLVLHPAVAKAQEAPLLSHSYTYAESATFRLNLLGQEDIDRATLLLTINGVSTDGETAPVEDGSAAVTRDLTRSSFPPFAKITYWWAFETENGRWVETDKQRFRYVDDRYTWRSIVADSVTIHWIDGEPSLLAQAVDAATDTVKAINAALQSPIGGDVDIYIYPSETDLASALQLGGQVWVSGIAYPQLGVILVAVPPNSGAVTAVQRDIPHELTHKALYDLLGPQGYSSLPTWLNEGLATFFEVSPDPAYARAIEEAQAENRLIPFGDLCGPFPEQPILARLAYAQSGSLVQYIRLQQGWSGIRELVASYADGQACSTGTQGVLGMDLGQLERDWRGWLIEDTSLTHTPNTDLQPNLVLQDIGPWALILGALLLTPVLVIAIGGRR